MTELLAEIQTPYPPSPRQLANLILKSRTLRSMRIRGRGMPLFPHAITTSPRFAPSVRFEDVPVPQLSTPQALADWLGVTSAQLDWFADVEGFRAAATMPASRHYFYSWVPRRAGAPRLIEAPKSLMKSIQRRILHEMLDLVPVHDAAHGFCKGRSCITSAQLHAGERVIIALDLKDFFLNVPLRRINGLFRCLGYPWAVARQLVGLTTTATPTDVIDLLPDHCKPGWQVQRAFQSPHLPQGAPTSPALANLCAWRLDCRLTGLAGRFEARYTRYGDDLAFSGDAVFARRADHVMQCATKICQESGFPVNRNKARIMGKGSRQKLTGLVVNQHINVPREQFDRLKATLFNCLRDGPSTQNRQGHADFKAHLDGRITWMENVNPHKGHRLRQLFQGIDWRR